MTVAGVTAAAVALAAVVTAPSSGVVAVAVAVVFDMMDGLVLAVTAAVSTVGTRPSSGVLKGRAEALCECWMLSQSQAQSLQTDRCRPAVQWKDVPLTLFVSRLSHVASLQWDRSGSESKLGGLQSLFVALVFRGTSW